MRWFALLSVGLALSSGGCVATVGTGPYVAASVPADVYWYPYTYYEGNLVYFVGDYAYYNTGGHWYYYPHLPPALYDRRAAVIREYPYVRSAPPAYRPSPYYRAPPVYGAPPAYRPPPTYHAPPAYRTPPAYRPPPGHAPPPRMYAPPPGRAPAAPRAPAPGGRSAPPARRVR